jgi:hypothetical protein
MEGKKDCKVANVKYELLEEKQKSLEKKHKDLKSRLHQIEGQV